MGDTWKKIGLRIIPRGAGLLHSHSMLPTPIHLGSVIRVFYASCDDNLRARIFFADLSPSFPFHVIRTDQGPVLDVGSANDFDCDGVNPSQIISTTDGLLLYYIGWRRVSDEVPYTLIAGVARSCDEGRSFEKIGQLLPLSKAEPYFRTAPFIYPDSGGWSVLYIGGGRFIDGPNAKRLPVYSLRRAFSVDGLNWPDYGEELCVPNLDDGEIGFGRPVLWRSSQGAPRLVISRRTVTGYSLMEASWPIRAGEPIQLAPVLNHAPEEWESEMTCFGAFCNSSQYELLFYNGNGFGRSGVGIAYRRSKC